MACELGTRRQEVGGRFVFGEGAPRGIMFIGQDGVQEKEETDGRPFTSTSGLVLRQVIEKLGLNGSCYITNVVSCRPCAQVYDQAGEPRSKFNYQTKLREPLIGDTEPTPLQVAACLTRLHQQIYAVDPVIIVALGGVAALALTTDRKFNIRENRGRSQRVFIPGALHKPSLTEKRKDWVRKLRGELIMPTVNSGVGYHMLPTYDPGFVLRMQASKSFKNPLDMFIQDLKRAATIYDDYMHKVFGTARPLREAALSDVSETT